MNIHGSIKLLHIYATLHKSSDPGTTPHMECIVPKLGTQMTATENWRIKFVFVVNILSIRLQNREQTIWMNFYKTLAIANILAQAKRGIDFCVEIFLHSFGTRSRLLLEKIHFV